VLAGRATVYEETVIAEMEAPPGERREAAPASPTLVGAA
jgi:hypothetical protein